MCGLLSCVLRIRHITNPESTMNQLRTLSTRHMMNDVTSNRQRSQRAFDNAISIYNYAPGLKFGRIAEWAALDLQSGCQPAKNHLTMSTEATRVVFGSIQLHPV